MRIVGLALGWIFLLGALGALGYDLARLARGEGFGFSPLGQLWFALDPGSLNGLQAGVERYVWEPLWDPGIVTVLQLPALPLFLVPGLILVLLCRRRGGPSHRRFFRPR